MPQLRPRRQLRVERLHRPGLRPHRLGVLASVVGFDSSRSVPSQLDVDVLVPDGFGLGVDDVADRGQVVLIVQPVAERCGPACRSCGRPAAAPTWSLPSAAKATSRHARNAALHRLVVPDDVVVDDLGGDPAIDDELLAEERERARQHDLAGAERVDDVDIAADVLQAELAAPGSRPAARRAWSGP